MKVLNIHKRTINQPKATLAKLLSTLATRNDQLFPFEKWPAMRFKQGLVIGAKGGHGPIRYTIKKIEPGTLVEFEFSKPKGFHGIHKFELSEIDKHSSELKHTIDMEAKGVDILQWMLVIGPLHDALIEDAFDKVENQFSEEKKKTEWSFWVKLLRKVLR